MNRYCYQPKNREIFINLSQTYCNFPRKTNKSCKKMSILVKKLYRLGNRQNNNYVNKMVNKFRISNRIKLSIY